MPRYSRFAVIALATLSASCTRDLSFPPPPQKTMPGGTDPTSFVRMLEVKDPVFQRRVVADVLGVAPGSEWTWTNARPRFKMAVELEPWDCKARFTVAKVVLDKVGPVTVSLIVNDHVLAQHTYKKDGVQELRAPVPLDVLKAADPPVIGLDIDPVYIAEMDGVKLGVLLESIGFKKAGAD